MSVRLVGGAVSEEDEEHSEVLWCIAARLKLGILAGRLVEGLGSVAASWERLVEGLGRVAASWERTTFGEKLEATVGRGEDVVGAGNLKQR